MEKSRCIRVSAYLQVGMVLKKKSMPINATVCDRIVVTAIDLQSYLALDSERSEHKFAVSNIGDYEMDGWDSEWRTIGERGKA